MSSVLFTCFPTSPLSSFDASLFRVLLLRRFWLPMHPSSRFCRCGRLLDVLGHHRAACAQAGVLGRRGHAPERRCTPCLPRGGSSCHHKRDGTGPGFVAVAPGGRPPVGLVVAVEHDFGLCQCLRLRTVSVGRTWHSWAGWPPSRKFRLTLRLVCSFQRADDYFLFSVVLEKEKKEKQKQALEFMTGCAGPALPKQELGGVAEASPRRRGDLDVQRATEIGRSDRQPVEQVASDHVHSGSCFTFNAHQSPKAPERLVAVLSRGVGTSLGLRERGQSSVLADGEVRIPRWV